MSRATKDYLEIDWSLYFTADSKSDSGLVRKTSLHNRFIGKTAGSRNYDSRTGKPHMWRVCLGKTGYWAVHRIVLLLNGVLVANWDVVDHIDGNPFNNDIDNLRVVSQRTNCQNRSKGTNSTGHMGCSITTNGHNRSYVSATVHINSKQVQVRYSIDDFGYELALSMAVKERERLLRVAVEQGEQYSNRHGK